MKVNLFHPFFSAYAALVMVSMLPAAALAGPDTVAVTRSETHQTTVVPWHKKIVGTVLVACGVVEPAPVYVTPGYLETTGPAPMLVYRPPAPLRPRRVTAPSETGEKPTVNPAASPARSPIVNPAASPAPAPLLPAPAPAPVDPEPGLLPETGNPAGQNPTDEMLSYFQRQRPGNRPNHALPAPSGGVLPNDPADEPSFLQVPQTPEQPALPPSRATYHVTP